MPFSRTVGKMVSCQALWPLLVCLPMAKLTEAEVLEALKTVNDPELHQDLS